MKKFISLLICIMLACSIPVGAATLEIDFVSVPSDMIFENSTAYVPLSDAATAMGLRYSFDEKTQSAFINGINLFPENSTDAKVYVNGKKYECDNLADSVLIRNGIFYLPAHLLADALGKDAKWYEGTQTLSLTGKIQPIADFSPDFAQTYAIVNLESSKALTAGDNCLQIEDYTKGEYQQFKFVKTAFDSYYHIQSVKTGKNLDINGHGTAPGVSVITWEPGDGDNQKFTLENVPGGTLISAKSCHLPIEQNGDGIIQNTKTLSDSQKWAIIPFGTSYGATVKAPEKLNITYTPVKKEEASDAPYRTFSIGNAFLADSDGLKAVKSDNSDIFKWSLVEYSQNVYVIENLATKKSLDVNARSLKVGDSIITWQTSKDSNQRWIFEQNGDGTYFIKSVHSDLYLTLTEDNSLVQEKKNPSLKQRWSVSKEY